MPINAPGNNRETDYFANMPQSQREAAKNLKRKDFEFDPESLYFDKSGPSEGTA